MKSVNEELPNVFNLAAYLIEGNLSTEHNDRIAFHTRLGTYTYAQVNSLVKRSAQLLSDLGIEQENRVSIILENEPEWVFFFLGAIWLGAVPVPINPTCSMKDIGYILQDSRSKVLLTTQTWQKEIVSLPLDYLHHTLLVDGATPFLSSRKDISELVPHAQTSPHEPAFWLYTSGSTGRPKGVIHAHQSFLSCVQNYGQSTIGLNQDDITYSVASMAFAYGLGNSLYLPMAMGAASVLSATKSAFDIVDDVKRYQPTVFFGIPSVYVDLLEVEDISNFDSSCLRLCVSAAEKLQKCIWQKWIDTHHLEICEGIGTTEFL